MNRRIIIGTRGSKLALWQTNWVRAALESFHPDIEIEISIIRTKGDRILDVSLPKLGEQGKGLFTRELEDAMLDLRIDLAVHSLKDLPTEFTAGLHLAAICEREDPRDAFLARSGIKSFRDLAPDSLIGTSSLRRVAQLRAARSDIRTEPVRGNVDTRIAKLDAGSYDAIVLAAAGVRRLGYEDRITEYLSEDVMLSAPGQGALGIESREDDAEVNQIAAVLNHPPTRMACDAERAFLKRLGGGCLVPIAALGRVEGERMNLTGMVASPDGSQIVRSQQSGAAKDSQQIGERLAEELLARGADRLLTE
ncbi:MAG: hydroxymethylbilane synthase [Acidobacteriota bacterium]